MLASLLGLSTLIFIKIRNFTKVNLFLFISLSLFWIALHLLLKTSNAMDSGVYWKWPLLIGTYQFVQACTRVPMGKLAQVLRSRKIPILFAVFLMIALMIPVLIHVSFFSIFFATIAAGVYGATFGMQNQHWAERWRMKHMYVTTAIVVIIFSIGKYTADIATWDASAKGNTLAITSEVSKWLVIAAMSVAIVSSIIYIYTVPKDPSKVSANNKTYDADKVSDMNLWDVMKYTSAIFAIGFIGTAVVNPEMVGITGNDFTLLKTLVLSSTIFITLLIAFFLVRFIKGRNILIASYAMMLVGLGLIILRMFAHLDSAVSIVGFVFTVVGANAYITTAFGQAFYTDNATAYLTLGIWLSIKSASISFATITSKEVAHYDADAMKWVALSLMIFLSLSFTKFVLSYKTNRHIYKMVDNYEREDNYFTEKMKRLKKVQRRAKK